MLVKIIGDHRLFVVKYQIENMLWLTTFFPTYEPNGKSVFETYIVEAEHVIPNELTMVKVGETSDYDFKVGDRVRYIGLVVDIINSLQGNNLTVYNIGRRDIGCIRDGETHLRFFAPFLLERI
jgi:hypothetical protein